MTKSRRLSRRTGRAQRRRQNNSCNENRDGGAQLRNRATLFRGSAALTRYRAALTWYRATTSRCHGDTVADRADTVGDQGDTVPGRPRAVSRLLTAGTLRGGVILRAMGQLRSDARPATYADLLALPEHVNGEIIGGELIVTPRPAPRHAVAASVLGGQLGPPYHSGQGGPGGWWILDEPELHLGDDVLVPDLAGWRRRRMPVIPDTAYFTIPPDWICEVLSPGTARLDRQRKLAIYNRERVAHAWLLDPLERTLEVLRLDGQQWVIVSVHGEDDEVRAEPFEDTTLPLSHLWA